MITRVLKIDSDLEAGKRHAHTVLEHSANGKRMQVVAATIESPEHIPPLDPDRAPCEHDPLVGALVVTDKHQPFCRGCKIEREHEGVQVPHLHEYVMEPAHPHGYCAGCNMDPDTGEFIDAVEIFVRNVSQDTVLARTSLISKMADESGMHVEPAAFVEGGDLVEAHFEPRGEGHRIPSGFTVRLHLQAVE